MSSLEEKRSLKEKLNLVEIAQNSHLNGSDSFPKEQTSSKKLLHFEQNHHQFGLGPRTTQVLRDFEKFLSSGFADEVHEGGTAAAFIKEILEENDLRKFEGNSAELLGFLLRIFRELAQAEKNRKEKMSKLRLASESKAQAKKKLEFHMNSESNCPKLASKEETESFSSESLVEFLLK